MTSITTPSGHKLPSRVFSAPMAGYTDPPYRELIKPMGSFVLFTEMIDSHALQHRNEKTMKMLGSRDPELFTQIAAGTVELAERALDVLLDDDNKTAAINLNMGCPAKKVVGCGGGSNLLRDPKLIQKICALVRKRTKIPFSVKFRSGWDHQSLNFIEVGKIFEGEGVDFIMLHARTRSQSFTGLADLSHIRELKAALKIPVIGNGDIVDHASAKRMIDETGCDGVAIGRGAIGNPWVYRDVERALMGLVPQDEPSLDERFETMIRHYQLMLEHYGMRIASHAIRKHLVGYMKGLPFQKSMKEKIFIVDELSLNHLEDILGPYFEDIKSGYYSAA